jgi:hypothetical protein
MVTCVNKTTHLECGPGSGSAIILPTRRRDGPDRPTARDAVIAELCSTIKIENIAANIGYWLSAQIGMHALPCSSKQRGESVGLPQGEGK